MKDRRLPAWTASPPVGRTPDGAHPSSAARELWIVILGGSLAIALLALFTIMLMPPSPPDRNAGSVLNNDRWPMRTLSQLERAGLWDEAVRSDQEVPKVGARAARRPPTPVAQYHRRRFEASSAMAPSTRLEKTAPGVSMRPAGDPPISEVQSP
jgi:hypothetical protein